MPRLHRSVVPGTRTQTGLIWVLAIRSLNRRFRRLERQHMRLNTAPTRLPSMPAQVTVLDHLAGLAKLQRQVQRRQHPLEGHRFAKGQRQGAQRLKVSL
jgi:hypothetical protein